MMFRIIGEITDVEIIASGRGIRELSRLKKYYGMARWRKLKGKVKIRLQDGVLVRAEIHWYEAHGVGRKEMKIKRFLEGE